MRRFRNSHNTVASKPGSVNSNPNAYFQSILPRTASAACRKGAILHKLQDGDQRKSEGGPQLDDHSEGTDGQRICLDKWSLIHRAFSYRYSPWDRLLALHE